MKLIPQTGDWILPCGKGGISDIIKKVTFGKVNHAAIVFDRNTTFETDGAWWRAKFMDVKRFEGREVYIVRPLFYTPESLDKVQELCKKYEGTPYSYVDIGTNLLFFWLKDQIRAKIVRLMSNKKFMICSELVARITYEATKEKKLRDFEGMTPQMLLELALNNPNLFIVEHTLFDLE